MKLSLSLFGRTLLGPIYGLILFSLAHPSAVHARAGRDYAVVAFEELSRLRIKLAEDELSKTEQERLAQLLFLHADCLELSMVLKKKQMREVSIPLRSELLCACATDCAQGQPGWSLFRLKEILKKRMIGQAEVLEARAVMAHRSSSAESRYLFAQILLKSPESADQAQGKRMLDELKNH